MLKPVSVCFKGIGHVCIKSTAKDTLSSIISSSLNSADAGHIYNHSVTTACITRYSKANKVLVHKRTVLVPAQAEE